MTCTGNSSQNCGAGHRNSVYQIAPGKNNIIAKNVRYLYLLCSHHTCTCSVDQVYFFLCLALPSSFSYVGCYSDDTSQDLSHRRFNYSHMTHELCASHCKGYKYMGLQVSTNHYYFNINVIGFFYIILLIDFQLASNCSCGNSYDRLGEDIDGCNQKCTGDITQTCGARLRNSVYQLHIGKVKSLICITFTYA